ncbi:hypothetical protein [Bradyrhizobium sp. USDA 3315]
MRSGGVVALVGVAAMVSYFLGHHDAPSDRGAIVPPPMPTASRVVTTTVNPWPVVAAPTANQSSDPQDIKQPSPPVQLSLEGKKSSPIEQKPKSDVSRRVEVALTAAAIAAILIQASRDQYHASGRPCACPDDRMRNGRACGGRSAHSRPGGAAPLCYAADVTPAMIEAYRKSTALR